MTLFTQGDKVLERFSKTRYLKSVTFVVAFLEATISPILPEAFLLLVLVYRKDISWKILSLVSSFGSACGALVMYVIGHLFYDTYGEKIVGILRGADLVEKAKLLFIDNAFMAQFMASLTPLPDRVFSFLAGAFLVSPFMVFVATFLGRLVRIAPIAYLSYEFGDEARVYIKKHTKIVSWVIVFAVLSFVAYSYFL